MGLLYLYFDIWANKKITPHWNNRFQTTSLLFADEKFEDEKYLKFILTLCTSQAFLVEPTTPDDFSHPFDEFLS